MKINTYKINPDSYILLWIDKNGIHVWARNKFLIGLTSLVLIAGLGVIANAPIILGLLITGRFP